MSSPVPKSPSLKSGTYEHENNMFSDLNNLSRFFATKALRAALTSPPLAKDVQELTFVYDKILNRLYTRVDGTLRYVQFT